MGNCNCNSNNCIIPIILGIVAAIIAVVVGTVDAIVNLTGVVLVIAAVILVILFAAGLLGNNRRREHDCMCKHGTCLLIGTFGALVTGIIAFVTGLETVLLLAFLVGFLTWMLVAALLILLCLVRENCD